MDASVDRLRRSLHATSQLAAHESPLAFALSAARSQQGIAPLLRADLDRAFAAHGYEAPGARPP